MLCKEFNPIWRPSIHLGSTAAHNWWSKNKIRDHRITCSLEASIRWIIKFNLLNETTEVLRFHLPMVLSTSKPKPLSDFPALCISPSFLPNTDWGCTIDRNNESHRTTFSRKITDFVAFTWSPLDIPNSMYSMIIKEPPVGKAPTYSNHKCNENSTIQNQLILRDRF